MMRLRLRTKLTLSTALLTLAVVASLSAVYVARLTSLVIREANERAGFFTKLVFLQAQHALSDAAAQGRRPDSDSPQGVHEYVLRAFDQNPGLASVIDAALGYSQTIYEVTIVDHDGIALVSSDSSLLGRPVLRRTSLDNLARSGFFRQMLVLYGPPRVYEVSFAFNLNREPFGEVRVGLSSVLLRAEISPALRSAGLVVLGALIVSTLLAGVVSGFMLAPLTTISAQLDRISAGQYDPSPGQVPVFEGGGDELRQVSQKISQVGQQLRGVHEIFTTMRENLNQVMAGLEDGLLLFTSDSRAVMVSPAAQKFLGAPSDQFLGRCAPDIFPPGHPLRHALQLDGDGLHPVAAAEAEVPTPEGPKRVGVSVQVIAEKGTRMALVTLRDQRHPRSFFRNHLHAYAHALRAFRRGHFGLGRRHRMQPIAIELQRMAQRMAGREDIGRAASQKLIGGRPEKLLGRRTHHHGARVAGKQQQTVFEAGHHLIQILAHGGENFVNPAQLLADLRNLLAHLAEFIPALLEDRDLPGRRIVLPRGNAVQLRGDGRQGREHEAADNPGKKR